MKRIIIFYGVITTTLAMEHQQLLRPIDAIRPIIISILTKEKPLSVPDLHQADKLIKEIRAQSPAEGFNFQDKLDTRVVNDSLKTDMLMTPYFHLNIQRPPSRSPSPLSTLSTN